MNELSELILTIDIREQGSLPPEKRTRVNRIKRYWENRGGEVKQEVLELCDYKVVGVFRNQEINLGIEYKTLNDYYSTPHDELMDKLAESFELYDDVALFLETGWYKVLKSEGDFHGVLDVSNGHSEPKDLSWLDAAYELSRDGVHVRQILAESSFPYHINNLLIYISKVIHSGLHIAKDKGFLNTYINTLAKTPGIGFKKALRLKSNYPNIFWLSTASEPSLQEVLGKAQGTKTYNFLHNHSLETKEWREGYSRCGIKLDIQNLDPEKVYHPSQSLDSKRPSSKTEEAPASPGQSVGSGFSGEASQSLDSRTRDGLDCKESERAPCLGKTGIHDNAQVANAMTPRIPGHSNSHTSKVSPNVPLPKLDDQDRANSKIHPTPIPCPDTNMQETKTRNKEETPNQSSILHKLSPATNSKKEEDRINPTSKLNLEDTLYKYYKDPHTLEEAIETHPWSKESIFNKTMSMKTRGLIRMHKQGKQRYYVRTLLPDEEKDIGV